MNNVCKYLKAEANNLIYCRSLFDERQLTFKFPKMKDDYMKCNCEGNYRGCRHYKLMTIGDKHHE